MSANDKLKDETANGTKPVLGEVYVFELKDGKLRTTVANMRSKFYYKKIDKSKFISYICCYICCYI